MRATMSWAAPAVVLALTLGCSHESGTAKKPPKTDGAPAIDSAKLVTLKVDGMS